MDKKQIFTGCTTHAARLSADSRFEVSCNYCMATAIVKLFKFVNELEKKLEDAGGTAEGDVQRRDM